jgi:hypothetical protein
MTFDRGATSANDDIGTYGATTISWKTPAARNLLLQLIEESPDANNTALARLLQERADEEVTEIVFLYFVHNHVEALKRGRRLTRKRRRRAISPAKAKAKVRAALLDLVMPNGKPLRDCTGQECERYGRADEQRGRWLQRVAAKVGPDKHVGEVLDERQLKALMRTTVVPPHAHT